MTNIAAVRNAKCIPWRNIIGWPVAGVWKISYAQSDVNAVCQNWEEGPGPEAGKLIAVVDDAQMVNLYRFPCPISNAQGREKSGHAAHVTNCTFSRSNVLFTTGGGDHILMQWRVVAVDEGFYNLGTARQRPPLPPPARELPWEKAQRGSQMPQGDSAGAAAQGVLNQLGQQRPRSASTRREPTSGKQPLDVPGYAGFQGAFIGERPPSGGTAASLGSLDGSMGEQLRAPGAQAARRPASAQRPSLREADLAKAASRESLSRGSSRPRSDRGGEAKPRVTSIGRRSGLTPAALECRRIASQGR